jgi:flagellar M-ring protein FliF
MDRAVRHVKRQGGQLDRISVAVVINEPASKPVSSETYEGAQELGGTAVAAGYSELEIERFTNLVKGVVGFNAERGDVVTIVSAKFEEPSIIENQMPWYESAQVMSTVKSLGAALTFIALLFIVIRPVIKSYLPAIDVVEDAEGAVIKDGELTQAELEMIELGDGESLEDIKAKLKPKKSTISADMLDTANTYDDKVALVRLLVAEDSGRVANVLKKMIKAV